LTCLHERRPRDLRLHAPVFVAIDLATGDLAAELKRSKSAGTETLG